MSLHVNTPTVDPLTSKERSCSTMRHDRVHTEQETNLQFGNVKALGIPKRRVTNE